MSVPLLRSLAALACFGIFSLPGLQLLPSPIHQTNRISKAPGRWTLSIGFTRTPDEGNRSHSPRTKIRHLGQACRHLPPIRPSYNGRYPRPGGFALDETLYLDGRSVPTNLQPLGATALKTRTIWSKDSKQLVSTYQIRTKQGKEGQLVIKRYLINEGKTEVVDYNLQLDGGPDKISARQLWQKQA
jgi:hypothetical protein